MKVHLFVLLMASAMSGLVSAQSAIYDIEPSHTYPSFEADHMGLSLWRGKFNKTAGKIVIDKTSGTGTVDITIDPASVDFGHEQMNSVAKGPELFDIAKYPQAIYKGKITGFDKGVPSRVVGDLTLHGVTKPVILTIKQFKCKEHPILKREVCGADALTIFNRDEFGIDAGKAYGFNMEVTLRIQIEAIKTAE